MKNKNQVTEVASGKYVYGIEGLATLYGCSTVTAQKIKNSGRIPYNQIGRKIIFDVDKVLAATEHAPNKRTGR